MKPLPTISAIATDYDETIAVHGSLPGAVVGALERFRASGRKLILDTGRCTAELLAICPRLDLFHRVVGENGATLYNPETGEEKLLTNPLPASLLADLARRGVSPIPKRRVILDTWASNEIAVIEAIRASGLDLHLVLNKESLIVLPEGIDKASGLRVALSELAIPMEETAGIGDAENDHALLDAAGYAVAVPNAIPALLAKADAILSPLELIALILG